MVEREEERESGQPRSRWGLKKTETQCAAQGRQVYAPQLRACVFQSEETDKMGEKKQLSKIAKNFALRNIGFSYRSGYKPTFTAYSCLPVNYYPLPQLSASANLTPPPLRPLKPILPLLIIPERLFNPSLTIHDERTYSNIAVSICDAELGE